MKSFNSINLHRDMRWYFQVSFLVQELHIGDVFNFCSWEICDFDFPISGHFFVYKSRHCWVPENKCSTFPPFFTVLLWSAVVCVIDIFRWSSLDFLSCVNLFIGMFHGLLYFSHWAVLSFWTAGRLLFGKFINYNIKIVFRFVKDIYYSWIGKKNKA